jgi:hypothetical protein
MRRIAPGQTVEAVGEAVEVEAPGHELPGRHGEQGGEERGKNQPRYPVNTY